MIDKRQKRKLRRLKPSITVTVSPSPYDDDYRLQGDATVVSVTEDGMVKVRFVVETYVSIELVEVKKT